MLRLLFILTLIIISSAVLLSQTMNDSIIVKEGGWGNSYYINGKQISKTKLSKIMKENPFSKDLMKSSSRKSAWGTITLLLGLVLTGTSVYEYWVSNNNYGHAPISSGFYPIAAVAVLGDILGVVFIANSERNFREAIKAYNTNLQGGSSSIENRFNLYLGFNGITLSYTLF